MLDDTTITGPTAQQIHQALWAYGTRIDAPALIAAATALAPAPKPGCVTNFQGAHIPVSVCPEVLIPLEGTLEGPPAPGNWHGCLAEWGAALHAVAEAEHRFRMVELGAGWGCWMLATGLAARARGLEAQLIGVEADARHIEAARATLALNGFAPESYTLHRAVAGPARGEALFPKSPHLTVTDWGQEAVFEPDTAQIAALQDSHERLPCLTLSDVAGAAPLDLLHIDIQGAELDFITGAWGDITRLVRRVLIGTHGRAIEGALMDRFSTAGWLLEVERPALCRLGQAGPEVIIDGVQLWKSPALNPALNPALTPDLTPDLTPAPITGDTP